MNQIYKFQDVRLYLEKWISSKPSKGFGEKSNIARALNVSPSFITSFMKEEVPLSSDQAFKLAQYLNLEELEKDYFLALIELDKALEVGLKKYLQSKLSRIKNEALKIANLVKHNGELPVNYDVYFSSWLYAFSHILVLSKDYNSPAKVSKKLNIELSTIEDVFSFLEESSLVEKTDDGYIAHFTKFHLPQSQEILRKHHLNLRLHAIRKIESDFKKDLHYSSVVSMKQEDAEKVRSILSQAIKESKEAISQSDNEQFFCFNLDFYRF